jgi:hypothetical protein
MGSSVTAMFNGNVKLTNATNAFHHQKGDMDALSPLELNGRCRCCWISSIGRLMGRVTIGLQLTQALHLHFS